jgi:hypothetical protein
MQMEGMREGRKRNKERLGISYLTSLNEMERDIEWKKRYRKG